MANKSSKSPSGEDREQQNEHIRKEGPDKKKVKATGDAHTPHKTGRKQENLSDRGYEEDQPHNPVRNTGVKKDQKNTPAGEPDKSDRIMKNNQTGPGLG